MEKFIYLAVFIGIISFLFISIKIRKNKLLKAWNQLFEAIREKRSISLMREEFKRVPIRKLLKEKVEIQDFFVEEIQRNNLFLQQLFLCLRKGLKQNKIEFLSSIAEKSLSTFSYQKLGIIYAQYLKFQITFRLSGESLINALDKAEKLIFSIGTKLFYDGGADGVVNFYNAVIHHLDHAIKHENDIIHVELLREKKEAFKRKLLPKISRKDNFKRLNIEKISKSGT